MKAKLRDLDKIKERIAENLSYLALEDMVRNECIESQGERLLELQISQNLKEEVFYYDLDDVHVDQKDWP